MECKKVLFRPNWPDETERLWFHRRILVLKIGFNLFKASTTQREIFYPIKHETL